MHEAVKLTHLTREVNEFYKGRQAVWREEAAEKLKQQRAEEAAELRRIMEEAEAKGEPPPEGTVSKALAATALTKSAEVAGVTGRIPLYQRRLDAAGEGSNDASRGIVAPRRRDRSSTA